MTFHIAATIDDVLTAALTGGSQANDEVQFSAVA
jgi:hypothetical protein